MQLSRDKSNRSRMGFLFDLFVILFMQNSISKNRSRDNSICRKFGLLEQMEKNSEY